MPIGRFGRIQQFKQTPGAGPRELRRAGRVEHRCEEIELIDRVVDHRACGYA